MKRLVLGLFCAGLLLGNVNAKLIGHWPLSPNKPIRIVWDADNGDANTWRTNHSTTGGSANIPIITLPSGDKVWETSGYKGIFSSALIPIDPSKQYKLSGTFRSTGSIDSKIYFGFVPILDDGTNSNQTPANAFRRGDDGIIQSWDDTSITLSNSPTGWNPGTVSLGYRTIGFYYDGDTSHLPDFIFYSGAYGSGQGSYTDISGSQITLSYPIPANIQANIQPGVTVVKNQYYGCSSYLYSVNSNTTIPQTWTTYSDTSTGDGWTQTQCEAFRPFTRFVRIMMLLNYGQSSTSTIQFDKIILEEVQGDEPERYELDPNVPTDAAKLNFSIVNDGNGKNVWQQMGIASRTSSEIIPIHTNKNYRLSGEFKTIGSTPATVYYGAQSVSGKKENINATLQNFYGNDAIIASYNSSSITTNQTLTSWWIPDVPNKFRAALAFYYNGDSNRLPDYVWTASPNGVYSNATGTTITLTESLPQNITSQIIPNVSVIKSVRTGGNGSALLVINPSSALPGSTMRPEIPTSWTKLAANITGEVWGSSSSAFHKFAEYAKLTILANEGATNSTLQIRNLKMETVNDGSHKVYDQTPLWGLAIDSRHHGSNYGATYTTGPNGTPRGAMNFDGENDYIDFGTNAGNFGTNSFSIALWVKLQETGSQPFLQKREADQEQIYWGLSNGKPYFIYNAGPSGTTDYAYRISNTTLAPNQWYHLTTVLNRNNSIYPKIYVDGVEDGSFSISSAGNPLTANVDNTGNFVLGKNTYGGVTNFFKGSLSDVRIYDHALSQAEINTLSGKKENFTSTATITTKNTNKTAIPKLLYWDLTSKQYWVGQTDGSLQRVSAPTSSFKNTTELTTIQTGKNATTGQLYWDTEKKKYYIGQPDGDLRPLSE